MGKIRVKKDRPLKWCSEYPLQCICDGENCKIRKDAKKKNKGIDDIIRDL